jgi:hypothetical protein
MKMNSVLVERTQSQLEAEAVPENHPMVPQLNRLFGEHTFFLDDTGLLIVEPTASDVQEGMVVKLASWKDESHMSLAPHEPEVTDMVVALDDAA